MITAIILFSIAALSFALGTRSLKEKGPLFNNAYLYASEKERAEMKMHPYYRQSAVVFFMIGLIFVLNGLGALFSAGWIFYIVAALITAVLVYAVVSSIIISKNSKKS